MSKTKSKILWLNVIAIIATFFGYYFHLIHEQYGWVIINWILMGLNYYALRKYFIIGTPSEYELMLEQLEVVKGQWDK